MTQTIRLTQHDIEALSRNVLNHYGLDARHVEAITHVVVAGQRDDCQSHGIYRLLDCVRTIKAGKVNLGAQPVRQDSIGAIIKIDADFGFSPLAFEVGVEPLVQIARQFGLGALVINHCVHFSALWPEIEALTDQGLVALAMTPSHAWVAPAGGRQPTFGTNPIAFGWPRPGKHPYVFDFATSAIARGEIELRRRNNEPIPLGWGVAPDGQPTTDAAKALEGAMLTFGGHKGSALSTMVELLSGALIGDWLSRESLAYDDGAKASPCHGELILAFDPAMFGDTEASQRRADQLFEAIASQGARMPSQRRYAAREHSDTHGIDVPRDVYDELMALVPDATTR